FLSGLVGALAKMF
uniref:Temporin-1R n=1 Tax=Pelophylax ridibundus TaxID=8406 RepID=TP1_PELRI|nr:RecName: Full=Temporin-1R [Pelophylax ridibundus]